MGVAIAAFELGLAWLAQDHAPAAVLLGGRLLAAIGLHIPLSVALACAARGTALAGAFGVAAVAHIAWNLLATRGAPTDGWLLVALAVANVLFAARVAATDRAGART